MKSRRLNEGGYKIHRTENKQKIINQAKKHGEDRIRNNVEMINKIIDDCRKEGTKKQIHR